MKLTNILLNLARKNPFPIGSIYMSVNSTNPSTLFGGTWEQIKDTFLLGCGDTYTNGSTGGSATHTTVGSVGNHTLTVSEMPSHTHRAMGYHRTHGGVSGGVESRSRNRVSGDPWDSPFENTGGGKAHNHPFTGGSMETMPPYLAVYVWKRTA